MTSRSLAVEPIPVSDRADAEVAAFLDACPTSFAQQTLGWRDVITGLDRDEPHFLGCRREGQLVGVLPAYRFEGRLGAILTSVPQAGPLGGIACHPDVPAEPVYEALLRAYAELATATGCALASVISNPFWPDRELYERHLEPDFVLENTCQVLDLDDALDRDGRFVGGSANLRRNLRKAESGALQIDEEQSAANVAEWYAIHAARHRAIGATPLPERMFTRALESMVPIDKARFFFVRLAASGEMVAGGFYVYHGGVIDALMPSASARHAEHRPNYLLGLHSMHFARQRGLRYYNWQGSPPEGGVHRFKRQWGSREAHYAFMTRVTGDARPFLESTVDAVRRDYAWHYVLPFDRIGGGTPTGRATSDRKAAWSALEAERR